MPADRPSGAGWRLLCPGITAGAAADFSSSFQDPWGLSLMAGLILKIPFPAADGPPPPAPARVLRRGHGHSPPTTPRPWPGSRSSLALYPLIRLPVYAVIAFATSSVVDVPMILGPTLPHDACRIDPQWFQRPRSLHRFLTLQRRRAAARRDLAALAGWWGWSVWPGGWDGAIDADQRRRAAKHLRPTSAMLATTLAAGLGLIGLALTPWPASGAFIRYPIGSRSTTGWVPCHRWAGGVHHPHHRGQRHAFSPAARPGGAERRRKAQRLGTCRRATASQPCRCSICR
ncbi:hypothetical protein DSL92_01635 [Billgrantia gudaonensis]|uniref:Uncharacterized protein n=1 Tax=Billgrantia gudaonensis TaxID=376427 RepID=A0A432JL79_9GAMM|nr:hypothetical protein DSL92_01635 [Halomonas gudaonensis]